MRFAVLTNDGNVDLLGCGHPVFLACHTHTHIHTHTHTLSLSLSLLYIYMNI